MQLLSARWRSATVQGEFRGTLVTYDRWSVVRGFAKITDAGRTRQGEMKFMFYPRTPDPLVVSGPSVSGELARS